MLVPHAASITDESLADAKRRELRSEFLLHELGRLVGGLDDVDKKKVRAWEAQFLKFLKEQTPEVRDLLAKEKKITDEVAKKLDAAIATFKPQFKA